jgi:hypothetical protein
MQDFSADDFLSLRLHCENILRAVNISSSFLLLPLPGTPVIYLSFLQIAEESI